jgi:hypothetical protein
MVLFLLGESGTYDAVLRFKELAKSCGDFGSFQIVGNEMCEVVKRLTDRREVGGQMGEVEVA